MAPISRTYGDKYFQSAIENIEDTYKSLELNIHPASIIGRILHNAKSALSDGDFDIFSGIDGEKKFDEKVEAILECLRIGEILKRVVEKKSVMHNLHKMLKGLIDPTSELRSEAKDSLFELEVLENLLASGINANLEEPDILFDFNDQKHAVACKCIYSENNMRKQYKKARDQINKCGYPGIIALYISPLIDHSNMLDVNKKREYEKIIEEKTMAFRSKYQSSFTKWARVNDPDSKVFGVLLVLTTFTAWEDEKTISVGTRMVLQMVFPEKHPNTIKLFNIYKAMSKRAL